MPGTFTAANPQTREPTDKRLRNTYESIHWSARERMSGDVDDYGKAGLVDFSMKGVLTEPDSPVVRDAEDQNVLPLPGPPERLSAVQWVNSTLHVSLMEDDMRDYERKILKLWGMQQLYTLTTDKQERGSSASEGGIDGQPLSVAERIQQLKVYGKRPTSDLSVQTPPELVVDQTQRSGTF